RALTLLIVRRNIRRVSVSFQERGPAPMASTPQAQEDFSLIAQGLMKNFFEQLGVPAGADSGQSSGAPGVADASRFAELQLRYFQEHAQLLSSALGSSAADGAPDRSDHRFSSPEWRNPWFDYLRRSYLLNAKLAADWVESLQVEPLAKERL